MLLAIRENGDRLLGTGQHMRVRDQRPGGIGQEAAANAASAISFGLDSHDGSLAAFDHISQAILSRTSATPASMRQAIVQTTVTYL